MEYKPRVKMTDELRRRYAVVEVPAGLEGLTVELLADPHDCVLSFGIS